MKGDKIVVDKALSKEKNITLVSKILLTLYIGVDLIYDLKSAEYDGVRWFYISIINLLGLAFIFKEGDYFTPFQFLKKIKIYFYLALGLLVVSCLSLLNALNVTEGLVHISRLVNILVGIFCVFTLFKNKPKELFSYLAKVITILVLYHSFYTLKYFLGNYDTPRTNLFVAKFLHYFGNVNIFTVALALKLPFAIYLFLGKEKKWNIVGLVAFFLGWLSIFFVGSRTANLSLSIVFVVILLFSKKIKGSDIKSMLPHYLKLIVPLLIVLFLGLNSNRVNKYKANSFKDVFQTIVKESLENQAKIKKNKEVIDKITPKNIKPKKIGGIDSGRFSIWKSTIELFERNPILGIGYGNYKLAYKERHFKQIRNGKGFFISSRRAHNDFLEKLAETGFIGFLLFLSLFVYILYILLLLMKKEEANKQVILTLFSVLLIYTFDSLLNFPIERPTAVVYFIFVSAVILAYFSFLSRESLNESSFANKKQMVLLLLVLIVLSSVYSNYLVYKSQVIQRTLTFDLKGKNIFGANDKFKYSYDEVKDMWLDYPNLASAGTNKYYQLALYAVKEKKYEEALEILELNKNHTEHQTMIDELKAKVYYFGLKNVDSGKFYAEKAFERYPSFYNNYFTLKEIYKKEKDNSNLLRVMNRYTNHNYIHLNEWKKKANYVFDTTRDMKLATKIIDTAMAYNPNNFSLIEAKQLLLSRQGIKNHIRDKNVKAKHNLAVQLFNQRKFNEAKNVYLEILKIEPKDYFALQNIGIIELAQGKYYEAIQNLTPVIKARIFKDGKAEYSRGYAYEKTNQFKKARADFRASRRKNYHQAMNLKEERYLEKKDLPIKR